MAFVEIKPVKRVAGASTTGVRISVSDRLGMIVAISGAARDALGVAVGDRVRFLYNADPALPRLRIEVADDGAYTLGAAPGGRGGNGPHRALWVRLGKQPAFEHVDDMKRLDCACEKSAMCAIDIDLPREFRRTGQHQPAGQPSTSTGPRPRPVTVPGVRTKDGAK